MTQAIMVPVNNGNANRIAGNLSGGTLIKNNDTTNAVWVSSQSYCSPGNGIKLGPAASTTWLADSECYACVDTGVTTPVALVFATEVGYIDDPIGSAEINATEMFDQFMNNVLVPIHIGLTIPGPSGAYYIHFNSGDPSISQFKSIYASINGGVNAPAGGVKLQFLDFGQSYRSPLGPYTGPDVWQVPWSVPADPNGIGLTLYPVRFNLLNNPHISALTPNFIDNGLTIVNNGPSAVTINLYGSYEALQEDVIYGNPNDSGDVFNTGNTAFTAGQTHYMGQFTGRGPAYAEFVVTSTLTGYWQAVTNNGMQNLMDSTQLHADLTGAKRVFTNVVIPAAAYLTFLAETTVTAETIANFYYAK